MQHLINSRLIMKLSILTLLVFVMPAAIAVGGTLTGTITDNTSSEGLFSATVSVKSLTTGQWVVGTRTDENGTYEIANVAAGSYTIVFSFVGFSSVTKEGVAIGDSDTQTIDIALVPAAIDLNAISVSASRSPEKLLDAPAAVNIVDAEEVQERTTLTPTEHLKGMPAVDVATTGLNQSNVVVRGFNNIFSGALLVLTDNRIARVPSLRFNAHNFISTVNEDIERIEIVSGPGSALYGPNSASGVMHLVTKSPFGSQGTTVSLGGGERDLMLGSFRHAGTSGESFGYKISGQYYQGNDWISSDTSEPATIQLFRPTSSGPETVGGVVANDRDFDVEKLALEGRMDFLLNENTSLIINSGFNRASSIELTGLGAGQAIDWTYYYVQSRLKYKDLFAQVFVNASDAGDTYLLRTGQLIVDKSKVFAGQVQHRYSPNERLKLTYGFDALFTRPNTDGTINGRNEDDDSINEIGGYVQAEQTLSEKVKLIGAARVDNNNHLDDLVFSPRAALVFKPGNSHNIRFTFNRAYSTPDNNNLFLDIMQAPDAYGIGALFEPSLGYNPGIDIRVQGVPESGFHWRMGPTGPSFRSTFAPVDPRSLSTSDFIDFNDPIFTNVMWSLGRAATLSGLNTNLAGAVADTTNGFDQADADAVMGAVNALAPAFVSGVENTLMVFNPDKLGFDPFDMNDIKDIERLKPIITETFEIGYKGLIGSRLRFAADLYRTERHDFIGPLTVETPNVFLDPATLQNFLGGDFTTGYGNASPVDQAYLDLLDMVAFGGNGNGSPVDELTAMFTTGGASIPFGTVTPEEAFNPDAVLVTYRNFGDVNYYGADLSFAYHLTSNWNVGGSYSYVSENFFEKDEDQVHDILLNAPKHKFSVNLQYALPRLGLRSEARFRFTDGFRMAGPFVGTSVESYRVLDLNFSIKVIESTQLALTIQNALDDEHVEFVGAPQIGRLAIARVTHTF